MSIQRDDWSGKFDNSGGALVPAETPKDHQQIIAEMEAYPASVPATSTAPVPAKGRGFSGNPDWGPPRDQSSGRYISKSDAQLREQWDKEGGFEANAQRVVAVEQSILNLSENPAALQAHIATLPDAIARKAADYMRISTYGTQAAAIKFEGFLNSLSPSEFETFHNWWRKLSRSDQDAILGAISR